MKHIICAIKDRALEAYMPLFQVRTEAQAIRALKQAVQNPQEEIAKHPEDYELHVIGYFDDSTGLLERLDTPNCIALAHKLTYVQEQHDRLSR